MPEFFAWLMALWLVCGLVSYAIFARVDAAFARYLNAKYPEVSEPVEDFVARAFWFRVGCSVFGPSSLIAAIYSYINAVRRVVR